MKILVTAGNTQVMIDRVRCLTNIFSGRTGAAIAQTAGERGHEFTLLTSAPDSMTAIVTAAGAGRQPGSVVPYRTFDDLATLLHDLMTRERFDAVIHAAAVNDYQSAGVYALAPGTEFSRAELSWHGAVGEAPRLLDRGAGKIKSDEPELWLRLTRAPKLVDRFRTDWGFRGTLVKFKLEVGVSDAQLLEIAERSRCQSRADWMIANTLEGAMDWAFLGPFADGYHKLPRPELPARLLEAIEQCRPQE